MTTRTAFAVLVASGLAATAASAQDTGALSGGEAATRSPSTTPIDAPPVTSKPIIGNERPGGGLVPGRAEAAGTVVTSPIAPSGPGVAGAIPGRPVGVITAPGVLPGQPGGAMMAGPARGFILPPEAGLDRIFAAAAASSGLAEVALGRLAAARASDAEVRLFAQAMVNDHTRANANLINLATQKAMAVPLALDVRDRAGEAVLMGRSGGDFDRAYARQQLAAHMDAVALFEAEAERGQDPQLKAWAARMLPTLQDHMRRARRLHDDLDARYGTRSNAATTPNLPAR